MMYNTDQRDEGNCWPKGVCRPLFPTFSTIAENLAENEMAGADKAFDATLISYS